AADQHQEVVERDDPDQLPGAAHHGESPDSALAQQLGSVEDPRVFPDHRRLPGDQRPHADDARVLALGDDLHRDVSIRDDPDRLATIVDDHHGADPATPHAVGGFPHGGIG